MRRALASGVAAVLLCPLGCGEPGGPALPPGKSGVPVLEFRYGGRRLDAWRTWGPDASAEERAATAFALAALEKDPLASVPTLLALLGDPEPGVQLAAAVAAGRLAPPDGAVAAAVAAHLGAPQEPLRRHARQSLAALGAPAVEPLGEALRSERALVRWGALVSLSALGDAAAACAPAVAALRETDPDPDVRRQALFSLPHLGPDGVAACVAALRTDDVAARSEAAAALARGGAAVVGPLAGLLEEDDVVVAAQAAGVLADLGPLAQPVLPHLLKALERAGPVRFNAAEALIAIGRPAVGPLEALLASPDEGLVAIARYALERIRGS